MPHAARPVPSSTSTPIAVVGAAGPSSAFLTPSHAGVPGRSKSTPTSSRRKVLPPLRPIDRASSALGRVTAEDFDLVDDEGRPMSFDEQAVSAVEFAEVRLADSSHRSGSASSSSFLSPETGRVSIHLPGSSSEDDDDDGDADFVPSNERGDSDEEDGEVSTLSFFYFVLSVSPRV